MNMCYLLVHIAMSMLKEHIVWTQFKAMKF